MMFIRKIFRFIDFFIAMFIALFALIFFSIRRFFGKIKIDNSENKLISLSKDGIYRIIDCNGGRSYFQWDFKRAHADRIYILYIGSEEAGVFNLGNKIVGINLSMPFEKIKSYFPFTFRVLQQIYGFIRTVNFIKEIKPKVLEVMFPGKLALRAILLKWLLPIKLVTQVRGNLDLIYYFNPYPCFFPFKSKRFPLELFQVMWDKFISILFYRACDLVIGYNINNMLSAISNGAHPAKTKLSRIKVELNILDVKKKSRNEIKILPQDGHIISLWSRLSPEKLVLESIQAFEKLVNISQADLHFIIMGDGPEKSNIVSYLSKSQHQDRVHLLGKCDRDFISQIALHSVCTLVPYGGSSLVEAVLLQVPVIAFDIEWHNELIRDGETGYLANFPDTDHLAQKMFECFSNQDEARKKAAAAKKLAEKMFDFSTIDSKESAYYQELFE